MLPYHRLTGDDKAVGKGLLFSVEVKTHHGVTTRSAYNLTLLAILFLGFEQGAQACGMCGYAIFWSFFPPVVSWSVIALVWFLAYSLVSTRRSDDVWQSDQGNLVLLPGMPEGLIWVVIAAVLSPAILGPIGTLPFFIPCFINYFLSLSSTPIRKWSPKLKWYLKMIGGLSLIALVVTGVLDVVASRKMDQADVMMKWDGTVLTRRGFNVLKEQEPDSIPLYRKIVREGESFTRARAAMRLAEVGDPEKDVPLLIEALTDEYRLPESERYASEEINEALHIMTRIKLPPDTPPEVWREKWEAVHAPSP